ILLVRSAAFVVAAVLGFVALAVLDAVRPTTSASDRFSVWIIGFSIARGLGVFAGAPLRRPPGKERPVGTLSGVLDALLAACGGFFIWTPLLIALSGPPLDEPATPRGDLILAAVSLLGAPFLLLHAVREARALERA